MAGERKIVNETNKRMLSDWFSAALQTSRKCERYTSTVNIKTKLLAFLMFLFVGSQVSVGDNMFLKAQVNVPGQGLNLGSSLCYSLLTVN